MPFATKSIRDRARRRIAQRVKAGEPCALCGKPIDLAIPWPEPGSFTVDHRRPTSHGGSDDYDGLQPAHFACNRQRSNLPDGTVRTNSGALDGGGTVDLDIAPATPRRHTDTSQTPETPR